MPDFRLPRRTFLTFTAAGAAVTALTPVASASSQAAGQAPGQATNRGASQGAVLDRAAGPVGDRVLALSGGAWVLADTSGAVTATSGLDGAEVLAVAREGAGFVAVGSLQGQGVIWESADGAGWVKATLRREPDAVYTAVGAGPEGVLVLGSLLTKQERVPRKAVAVVRTQSRDWLVLPVKGLGRADQRIVTAVGGDATGWTATAVDPAGSQVFHSPDGQTWSGGTRVTASAVKEISGVNWVGNALDDTAPVRGVIGGGREVVGVPVDAHAVGGGFWLSSGRLVREA
jgi:hypothetical protein